jgi:peptidoglycan/xylan/chitin deacetylase (PgdA/CDA1 family)
MIRPTSLFAEAGDSAPSVTEYQVDPSFVNAGPGFGNRVALTFDDGPTPGVTPSILKDLSQRNLKATFFMIGKKAETYSDLAKAVIDEGHEVANHTYTHPNLARLADSRVEYELKRGQEAVEKATGGHPVWFRPPYGAFKRPQGKLALKQDLGIAYWSVDPMDWKRPGASAIANSVVSRSFPGAIILLHDLHQQTAEAVPAILDGLMERDFVLTKLSGFLGHPYPAPADQPPADTPAA